MEITEKQLAEGSVLSNSLKYKKTISGHFIDLSAITLFMEAFSKVSNIPATAVVFSEILSTITEKQKDIIVNGLARILICCEESVSYTKNIINLFGLANSDILSSAVEEAILCCYNPKRDQSLPLRFVQPLRVEEARMLDIGFYRARVKEIDNRIASRNFSLSRQAKLEAHQSALLHLTEIAKMQVSRYLQSAVRERIGFACDLIRKCSGSEKQDYIEQTKRVFTESEWRDRNSFFSFYENLVETAYVSLTNSDYDSTISNEFQELFADIHLLEPEVIKQIFPDIMDAVFEVALSFQENLKLAISNLVFFANSPNNRGIQNFLLEKIELSLKEMLITNILEGLDVDNNYLDLHDKILEACSDDFTPEQKRALLKKALEQIADYVSIDPNEPGYATKDKLKKLISKIGTIRSRYYLDPEFVQEIISKINSLLN